MKISSDFKNHRKGGIIGINIDEETLVGARLTTGENDIVLVTSNAQSIRFNEKDLRDQGVQPVVFAALSSKANPIRLLPLKLSAMRRNVIAGASSGQRRSSVNTASSRAAARVSQSSPIRSLVPRVDGRIMMFTLKGRQFVRQSTRSGHGPCCQRREARQSRRQG